MTGQETALNLSTKKAERPKVSIDDVVYHIAIAEDFKLREFLWIEEKGILVVDFLKKGYNNLDNEEFESLEELLKEITAKVMIDVPEKVLTRLNDFQRIAIIELFTETVERKNGETPRSDGTRSSPDSKDSTAVPSKAG